MAGPRVVPHALNTRDLGGLRGPGGRRLRAGMVYRGSAAGIGVLPVRTVLDLRHVDEFAARPTGTDLPVVLSRPVVSDRVAIKRSARPQPSDYLAYYRLLVTEAAPVSAELLDLLTEPARLPVLVCCSLGKDRTSVVCGLALRALGVRRADLARDHALSGRLLGRDPEAVGRTAWGARLTAGERAARLHASDPTLGALLLEVEAGYGSAGRLLQAHGLEPERLRAVREKALVPC